MCTSRTLLAVSASSTGWEMSVSRSSVGFLTRILATSTATLPTPITATDSASRRERGRVDVRMPAVPVDEVGRREAAGQVLAGDAQPAVPHRAGRVHHRVVAGQQVLAGHVGAQVHAADEVHAVVLKHAAQVLGDRLDRLVVGRDTVADQAVRGRQPVDDVDPDGLRRLQRGGLLDQCLGGVQASRA